MPSITRITDIGSGHSCYPPTQAIEGSSNVIACGKGVFRKGDSLEPHSCSGFGHPRHAQGSSSTVFVNSKGVVRVGDVVDCGGEMITGCSKVIVG